jgi:hypothetical protein
LGNIVIFAGGFGSGKSEVALNYALQRAEAATDVIMADLDLVNPYFASRDVHVTLEGAGIRLVAPTGELSFGDVPSIPGEIIGLLRQDNNMVIDVAGDEVGSLVLGYLSQYILARPGLGFFLVLNPYRPFAQNIDNVRLLKHQLERAASFKFTGIVSNPNLLEETSVELIRSGHEKVLGYGKVLDLPVVCLAITREFYPDLFPIYGEILQVINLYLKPEWL